MIHQRALYLSSMPKGDTEDLLLFVVPRAPSCCHIEWVPQGCGHQGHDHTLSLLWEWFWWPGMAKQMQQSIKSCTCCLQHEGNLSKVPLHPIVATTPMNLLHVDFISIEMTLDLNRLSKVTNVLVFQDHFTKHIMVYVTPDQTVARFLYQGYFSIFEATARILSDRDVNFMSSIIDEMCKLLGMKKL